MAAEADRARDLLFGLLALQTGMIEQGDLFTALNDWKDSPRQSIAQLLLSRGAIESDQRVVIDSLVAARGLGVHRLAKRGRLPRSIAK